LQFHIVLSTPEVFAMDECKLRANQEMSAIKGKAFSLFELGPHGWSAGAAVQYSMSPSRLLSA
jgi:hypothetical protein